VRLSVVGLSRSLATICVLRAFYQSKGLDTKFDAIADCLRNRRLQHAASCGVGRSVDARPQRTLGADFTSISIVIFGRQFRGGAAPRQRSAADDRPGFGLGTISSVEIGRLSRPVTKIACAPSMGVFATLIPAIGNHCSNILARVVRIISRRL